MALRISQNKCHEEYILRTWKVSCFFQKVYNFYTSILEYCILILCKIFHVSKVRMIFAYEIYLTMNIKHIRTCVHMFAYTYFLPSPSDDVNIALLKIFINLHR